MPSFEIGVKIDDDEAKESLVSIDDLFEELKDSAKKTGKAITKAFSDATDKGIEVFEKGLRKAGKTAKKTFTTMKKGAKSAGDAVINVTKALRSPAGMIAGFVSAGTVATGFFKTIEQSTALRRMSQNTGVAIEKLEEWRIMASLAGGEMDNLSDAVQDFTEKMGEASFDAGSSWAEAFRNLGVVLDGDVSTAIDNTLYRLAEMVDQGQKAEAFFVGVDLFGDAFKTTFAEMVSEGIEPFEQKLKDLQELRVFDENLMKIQSEFITFFNRVKTDFSGFVANLVTGALDNVTRLSRATMTAFGLDPDKLGTMTKAGEDASRKISGSIDNMVNAFAGSGGIVDTMIDAFAEFQIGFSRSVGWLRAIFSPSGFSAIGEIISSSIDQAGIALSIRMKSSLVEGFSSLGDLEGISGKIFAPLAGLAGKQKESLTGLRKEYEEIDNRIQSLKTGLVKSADVSDQILSIEEKRSMIQEKRASFISEYNNKLAEQKTLLEEILDTSELTADQNLQYRFPIGPQQSSAQAPAETGDQSTPTFLQSLFGTPDERALAFSEALDETLSFGSQMLGAVQDVTGAISSYRQAQREAEINKIRKSQEKELSSLVLTGRRRAMIEEKNENMVNDLKKKSNEKRRRSQISKLWIDSFVNGASAFGQAVSQFGFPAGPIIGGLLQGLLLTQAGIATAQAQAQPLNTGGIVGGSFTGARGGGDNVLVHAREDEMYLNADQQSRLWDYVSGQREMSGGNTINYTNVVHGDMTDEQVTKTERVLKTLQENGRLAVQVVA